MVSIRLKWACRKWVWDRLKIEEDWALRKRRIILLLVWITGKETCFKQLRTTECNHYCNRQRTIKWLSFSLLWMKQHLANSIDNLNLIVVEQVLDNSHLPLYQEHVGSWMDSSGQSIIQCLGNKLDNLSVQCLLKNSIPLSKVEFKLQIYFHQLCRALMFLKLE